MKTLGYNTTVTLLLTAPPYAAAFVGSIVVAFSSAHFKERCFHIVIPLISSLIGNIMAMLVPGFGLRYFSIFLTLFGVYA